MMKIIPAERLTFFRRGIDFLRGEPSVLRCKICPNKGLLRCGFSLVELLVVVSVITLLAAILLPTMAEIKERTYLVVCLNNVRQLGLAHITYSTNNKGGFPFNRGTSGDSDWTRASVYGVAVPGCRQQQLYLDQIWGTVGPIGGPWNWYTRKPPGKYLSDYKVYYCPGYTARLDKAPYKGPVTYGPGDPRSFGQLGSGQPVTWQGAHLSYVPWAGASGKSRDGLGPYPPYHKGYGLPSRVVPKGRPLSISSPGVCWLVSDLSSHTSHRTSAYVKGVTFPYNVVHLDGHADTHRIERCPYTQWVSHNVNELWSQSRQTIEKPYGWHNSGKQTTGLDTDEDKIGR